MNTLPSTLAAARPRSAGQTARVRSQELLRGGRELVIEHRGQEYRLILTRNDKLILNK